MAPAGRHRKLQNQAENHSRRISQLSETASLFSTGSSSPPTQKLPSPMSSDWRSLRSRTAKVGTALTSRTNGSSVNQSTLTNLGRSMFTGCVDRTYNRWELKLSLWLPGFGVWWFVWGSCGLRWNTSEYVQRIRSTNYLKIFVVSHLAVFSTS